MTPSLTPNAPPFRPKEEGADHVRLEFPLAGVARKTLHLKVAGIKVEVTIRTPTIHFAYLEINPLITNDAT